MNLLDSRKDLYTNVNRRKPNIVFDYCVEHRYANRVLNFILLAYHMTIYAYSETWCGMRTPGFVVWDCRFSPPCHSRLQTVNKRIYFPHGWYCCVELVYLCLPNWTETTIYRLIKNVIHKLLEKYVTVAFSNVGSANTAHLPYTLSQAVYWSFVSVPYCKELQ